MQQLHRRLRRYAQWLCPVADVFVQDDWHWSIRQADYSTDPMFRSREILVPLYDSISRQAVLAADAPRVAGFLGKKITPALAQEIGSRLSTRIEGRCIKHYMGAAGVKVRIDRVSTQTSYGPLEGGPGPLSGKPFKPGVIALRQKVTQKTFAASKPESKAETQAVESETVKPSRIAVRQAAKTEAPPPDAATPGRARREDEKW